MKKLIIIGGCSKSGKSTLTKMITEKYQILGARKTDLIIKMSKIRKIPIIENFELLEKLAFTHIRNSFIYKNTYLLELHYAIQPNLDNEYFLTGVIKNEINELYKNSTCIENIKLLASSYNPSIIYLDVKPEIVLKRRINIKNDIPPRSLSIKSIKNEIQEEYRYFIEFYNCSKSINKNTQKYIISCNRTINESIRQLEKVLSVK